jgi:hypothetical protein
MMINMIMYYMFYCSAVLFYGIGLNRTTVLSRSMDRKLVLQIIKCMIAVLCSVALTWLIIMQILVPAELVELYPVIALLIFISITVFLEIIIRITAGVTTSEFSVSYLIILLALSESTGIADALIIAASSMASFILILPVLYALRQRIEVARPRNDKIKKKSFIMLTMAVIIICLAAWNVSWLNRGVL